jgi:lipoyl(octanoyl) transferase
VKTECVVHHLGLVPYEQAWQLQDRLAIEIAAGTRPATLLLLEHPHTYTFGRSGKAENLLWDQVELDRRGVSVHWVDRGGDVTYHGLGQLVGYPLLSLGTPGLQPGSVTGSPDYANRRAGLRLCKPRDVVCINKRLPQADYVGYIRKLELALIRALDRLGVASEQVPNLTGVWIRETPGPDGSGDPRRPPAKVAAIGVKVDARGVSRHGFALNVNPDMSYWEGIIGCGLADYPVTSLAEWIQPAPPMEKVREVVIEAFGEVFGYRMVEKAYA